MKKIIITGGHLTPAQAVIGELKKNSDWEIYYFGRRYATEGEKTESAESKIIPKLGIKFISITTGRLQRQFSRHTIPSLLKIPLGILQSFYWIIRIKPNVICSFGGYVSVPAVISGWLLRIPILTHEQTITFGLSSRINSHFVNKIAVSFPDSVKYFPKDKVVFTGNPIRKEIFETRGSILDTRYSNKLPIIYITGGNQGSQLINNAIDGCLSELLKKYIVVHQCGGLDYDKFKSRTNNRYFLFDYVGPDKIGTVFNTADLVVSRAGANTVYEVAALGKPTLFIPIPWTFQDEQTKNAKILKEIGIAEILLQKDLTPKNLLKNIELMINNLTKYRSCGNDSKKLINLNAAKDILKIIDEISK